MSEHPNATLARTLIAAFLRGDLAAVASHFADDAVWELPGRGVLAGEYKGPEAIVGFLGRSFELSGGTRAWRSSTSWAVTGGRSTSSG